MMLLLYILIGAVIGAFVSFALQMKCGLPLVMAVSALGGLVGGLVFHIVIPMPSIFIGILGACIGAVGLMAMFSFVARKT